MPLYERNIDKVETMFKDSASISTVLKVLPYATKTTLYRMQHNLDNFRLVCKPSTIKKRIGRPRLIEPYMREYLISLLAYRNDLQEEELVFKLQCQFDVAISQSTTSRMLKDKGLSNKVNTQITSK